MLSLDQLSQMVQEHLGLCTEGFRYTNKWTIGESQICGRGLIATEDIRPGDVLFVDHPLLYGPRASNTIQRGCTVCGKMNGVIHFKCEKCSLLLCSRECQFTTIHNNDCLVIKRWHNKLPIEEVDDASLSKALTSIRAIPLAGERMNFMVSLVAHTFPRHGSEIQNLKDYFEIPESEEEIMITACRVLDANAFLVPSAYNSDDMAMRGLYPVAALMNHSCVPNTRNSFNKDHQMTVKAVKPIPAGAEIFTCYSGLLWGTPARRAHLFKTKHFWCYCDRCADTTERGTLLSALKCFATTCPGYMIANEPLNPSTSWRCLECGLNVPPKNICVLQAALGSLMGNANFENIDSMENFLINRITKFIPRSNQIVVDLECRLIWLLGETDGFLWHELSEHRLSLKERLCRGTLRTLAALAAGDAHLRGLLLYHLHAVMAERARRDPVLYEELKEEIETTIDQAYYILQDDITAPPDLDLRWRYMGPGSEKPRDERLFILES